MKEKLVALSVCMATIGTFADIAKVGIVVVDESTLTPIEGVTVKAWFQWNIGWRAWSEPTPIVTDTKITDQRGFCRLEGKTNIGEVGVMAQMIPGKYYAGDGNGFEFKRKNFFGVWQPDNLVATIALQRVEHPIPLWVKKVTLDMEKDVSLLHDGKFYFDFLAGDFLPPLGKGLYADVMFRREAREDCGEGENGANVKGRSFRDTIWVSFLGKENGLIGMKCNNGNGIRIRQAPESGYWNEYSIWRGVGKDLQCESSYNKDRNFCFRIRTERGANGFIGKAWYGKIYGDIKIWAGENYSVNGVSFFYYLNPIPLDRNLEWDMKNNLCPNPGSLGQPQP